MTLPIQTIIDTHEALSDWRFTAQEANQVIASVWGSVMGAIMLTAAMGMFGMAVSSNPNNPGHVNNRPNATGSYIVVREEFTGDKTRCFNPLPRDSPKLKRIADRLVAYLSDVYLTDFSLYGIEQAGRSEKILPGIPPVSVFHYDKFSLVADVLGEAATRVSEMGIPKLQTASDEYSSLTRMASYVDIGTLVAYSGDGEVMGGAFASRYSEEKWGKAWEMYGIFSFSTIPRVGEAILSEVVKMAKQDSCTVLQCIPEEPKSLNFFERHGFKVAPGEEGKPLGEATWIKYLND